MKKQLPLWVIVFGIMMGVFVTFPFLAPVCMKIGWDSAGKAIYFVYSFFCHQLPERSYFLFGKKLTYTLAEIQSAWQNTNNMWVLRQFTGNPDMGWKVAWSDRMVSMYSATWLFGLAWWPLRRRVKPLPIWGLILFLLPMAVDGITHMLSDLSGIGHGFRDANTWLAIITNHILPANFYAGDAWGSFNSLMRLLTGILFGLGIVLFTFPYLNWTFSPDEQPVMRTALLPRPDPSHVIDTPDGS
jgi:uncharacterized membrane protein